MLEFQVLKGAGSKYAIQLKRLSSRFLQQTIKYQTMVATDRLATIISDSIRKAQKEEIFFEEIYANSDVKFGKNEFLFFLKPELQA